MRQKFLILFSCLLIIFFIPLFFYFFKNIYFVQADNGVIYQLPYPGLLPDHPLYPIKKIRDKIIEITTRDLIKKANLYLLYADKKASSAVFLFEKGKINLAITTLDKARIYLDRLILVLEKSKNQGTKADSVFVQRVKLAQAKYLELANEFLKKAPQGDNIKIKKIIDQLEQQKTRLTNL